MLVLNPNSGDSVQMLKAGVMEACDVYVINKADLEGTERLESALKSHLELAHETVVRPIVKTVATRGEGVAELSKLIAKLSQVDGEMQKQRAHNWARERLQSAIRALQTRRLQELGASHALYEPLITKIAERQLHPDLAAQRLLDKSTLPGGAD